MPTDAQMNMAQLIARYKMLVRAIYDVKRMPPIWYNAAEELVAVEHDVLRYTWAKAHDPRFNRAQDETLVKQRGRLPEVEKALRTLEASIGAEGAYLTAREGVYATLGKLFA